MQFKRHYTRDEARAILPKVRIWLSRLLKLGDDLKRLEQAVSEKMQEGADLGGKEINARVRCMADINKVLMEFFRRDILVKDPDRGLIDFPAFVNGKEVFLCWEKGEEDIDFWHELEAGYAGRIKLED